MISSTEDAERFFHISGFRISTISYNGTSIGLPSIVAHANFATFVVGGFQKMLNKGWVGEVSLDAIANNLNFGTSVIIQTSNDGVTWSDQAAATTNRRLVYTNSTPYTIGNYLRVLLRSNSGTASTSELQCRFSNLKITGIDGSLRDFYYNKNLIIDYNGNVGIGTTNPSSSLTVQNSGGNNSYALRVSGNNTEKNYIGGIFDTHVAGTDRSAGALALSESSSTASVWISAYPGSNSHINNGGNVGIGTSSPGAKLELNGADNKSVSMRFRHQSFNGSSGALTELKSIGSNLTYGTDFTISNRDSNGAFQERLRVDFAGNVGIGTATPLATLAVQDSSHGGSIQIGSSSGEDQYQYINLANNWQIGKNVSTANPIGQAGSLYIYNIDQSKTNLCITSDGNVGIGTTNPVHKLHIDAGTLYAVTRSVVDNFSWDMGVAGSTASNADLRGKFYMWDATNSQARFVIDSTGNVGIGTTNPVSAHGRDSVLVVGGGSSFESSGITLGTGSSYANGPYEILTSSEGSHASFKISDGTINRLTIKSNGNVGIGTTSPINGKLEVLGASSGLNKTEHVDIAITQDANFTASKVQLRSGVTSGTNPYFAILTRNNNGIPTEQGVVKERMRITSAGNVGIGTADPGTNKLYVNGNIFANGTITPTSDDRVKHNEQTIVGAIEILGKLTPKKYIKTTEMYDADHDFELDANGDPVDENGEPVAHAIEAGVIAQKVLEVPELAFTVSPEGVDEDGNVTSPHGLNYNSLFTYAIAAIQEQQQLIEDLKSRIETLES